MRQRSELISVLPTEGKEQRYEASFVKMLRAVKAMSDAGVPVVAGTDSMAGMGLERELELFVEGGFTPLDALRADICTAARTMKVETKTGTIAPGMTADLLVVDGDPLAKIEDLEKTVATVRSGTVYDDAELWNAVSIRPATDARLTVVTSSAAR